MTNHKSLLFFSILLLCLSCTKELDITSKDTVLTDPVKGKLRTIKGTVLDTLRQPVNLASVKGVFDDFIVEAKTALDGSYVLHIPETKQKGAIIAAKDEYLSSIINISSVSDSLVIHFFARSVGSSALNELSNFNVNDIFTATGRVVDQNGVPLPGKFVFGFNFGTITPNGFSEFGTTMTDEEGRYEISGRKVESGSTGILSYIANGNCRNFFGQPFDVEFDAIVNVPDLVINTSLTSATKVFTVEADQCTDQLMYFSFAIEPVLSNFAGNSDGQPLALNYCNTGEIQYFYAGAYTQGTGRYFDGGFHPIYAPVENFQIRPCRPDGHFFEAEIGDQAFQTNIVFNSDLNRYESASSESIGIAINLSSGFSSFTTIDGFNTLLSYGRIDDIQIIWEGKTYTSATEYQFYFLAHGIDQPRSGVIQSVLKDQNGNLFPFKALFRVQ